MITAIPLVYQHVRPSVGLLALVAISLVVLALLGFVAWSFIATGAPSLDGPELAPFRWLSPEVAV
jgi:hypothetical protein